MGDDTLNNINVRTKQEVAPHFIDLALELAQFASWCLHECDTSNLITHACKSIRNQDSKRETMLSDYRKKSRPRPWRYGDEFLSKENETHSINVCSPSVVE